MQSSGVKSKDPQTGLVPLCYAFEDLAMIVCLWGDVCACVMCAYKWSLVFDPYCRHFLLRPW